MYEDEHEVEVPPPHAQHMLFEEKSLSSASVLPHHDGYASYQSAQSSPYESAALPSESVQHDGT